MYDIVMTGYAGLFGSRLIYEDQRWRRELSLHYSESFFAPLVKPEPEAPLELIELKKVFSEKGLYMEAGEGGVYAALWELLRSNRLGADFSQRAIPVLQQTIELCEAFSLDPYRLRSDGTGIWLCQGEAFSIMKAAKAAMGSGAAALIGTTQKGTAIRRIDGEETAYLRRPSEDELYRHAHLYM